MYERIYYEALKYAIKNKQVLKNVTRKEKLGMLQFFIELYWN